eukprot:26531_1
MYRKGGQLLNLPANGAALGQARLAAARLAQHGRARGAEHNGVRVREHGRELEAARALDVHKVRVRALNEALQLVLLGLESRGRVQEVVVDRHGEAGGAG